MKTYQVLLRVGVDDSDDVHAQFDTIKANSFDISDGGRLLFYKLSEERSHDDFKAFDLFSAYADGAWERVAEVEEDSKC